MIIKQLELINIRSHESTKIEFAEGKTLVRGDIGSGKSSIMMSIEAALFGGSKQLIRKGKENGTIRLTFETKDENNNVKKYTITRNLKTTGQKPGIIKYHDEKKQKEFTAIELSIEISKILNINQTKKAQEIFNYFVLAKQGELKALLGGNKSDLKERTDTLMIAFDMEVYKFAVDNAKILNQRIEKTAISKKGEIKRLDEVEIEIKVKNDIIKKMKNDLEIIEKSFKIKKENFTAKNYEYDKVKEERTKISVANELIKAKEKEINEKKEEIRINSKKIDIKKDKLEKSGKTIDKKG